MDEEQLNLSAFAVFGLKTCNMLPLLVLLAVCLVSSGAQTTTNPLTQPAGWSPVLPTADRNSIVAVLQTAVQSSKELNGTNVAPILNGLSSIIRQLQPNLDFTLRLKNITQV